MNLAHPAHHRGLGVGVTAANALGMSIGPYSSTAPSLHQRSPFAIQELLGLNHSGQESTRTPTAAHHHPHHPAHSDSIISASSYIPRTMGVGVGVAGCPTSQTTCLGDGNPSHPSFPSWRPNFMPFSTMSTMSSTGTHPHHQMLNLGASQTVMHPSPGDSATGEEMIPMFTFICSAQYSGSNV